MSTQAAMQREDRGMELYGDNSAYGTVRVDLNDRRYVLPVDGESEPFPKNVGGLIPVICTNRRGSERTVYAFATPPAGDAAIDDADPRGSLLAALDIVNDVLEKAGQLIQEDLGQLVCAYLEIAEFGFGFTHAEVVSSDSAGAPTEPHVRLTIETSDTPGAEGTASCSVGYDPQGRPSLVSIVAHDTAETGVRISASWRHDLRAFHVVKVEDLKGRLIYKAPAPKKRRAR